VWNSDSSALTLNEWNYVTATYDTSSTTNHPVLYVNGQAINVTRASSEPTGTPSDSDNYIFIGNRHDGARTFDGIIDEARITDDIKSADWIETEYNNQNDPASFYTLGSAESESSAVLGNNDEDFLTNGLVGYWKMD